MAWFIGQSLLVIAAAFLLGILVGWLIWGLRRERPQTAKPAQLAVANANLSTAHDTPTETHRAPSPTRAPDPIPAALAATAVAPIAEPDADVQPIAEAEQVAEPEPAAEAEPVAEPEPAAEGEPVAEVEQVAEAKPMADAVAEGAAGDDAESVGAQEEAIAEAELAVQVETADDLAAVAGEAGEERSDDLERIEGIGPQMSRALTLAGIRTYDQLAETDQARLRQAIEARGLKFAPSLVTWAQQAQLLADGDEDGFADLTRRLVAGRDEGRL